MAVTGTRVLGGRYALQEVLGTGGMATVWRARDEVLGRDVAVKVLSPQYAADPGFLARFEREARHAARLSHPHLVTVFDCGVDQTMPFIVMELVTGPTRGGSWTRPGHSRPAKPSASPQRSARRWTSPTRPAWCTATSSPPTSCWPRAARSRCWTSASPAPTAAAPPGPRPCWAPLRTCPRNRPPGRPRALKPTCTPWAACCLRCSRAPRRSRRLRSRPGLPARARRARPAVGPAARPARAARPEHRPAAGEGPRRPAGQRLCCPRPAAGRGQPGRNRQAAAAGQ